MGEVVYLRRAKEVRSTIEADAAYQAKILGMDKLELLEEMVKFQEKRSHLGRLTPQMMVEGKVLFRALELAAETEELRILARSYRRHLEYELADYSRSYV